MISVVIPTYKRTYNLIKLINSINEQTYAAREIIIVASGYQKDDLMKIKKLNPKIIIHKSSPSVCKQRNIGISKATHEYILLCDDDIILPKDYLKTLISYCNKNKNVKIVTGCEHRKNATGKWEEIQNPVTNFGLLFSYIFGLGVCFNLNQMITPKNIFITKIINSYKIKGNYITKAGWPVLTNFDFPVMKTSIYGLGCAMIKRELLQKNLYSEELGPNGIGDNFEVALKINKLQNKIHVLRNIPYKHFKVEANRYENHINYKKRCYSLYKFLKELPIFTLKNRLFFIWSLIGNGIRFLIKKDTKLFKSNQEALNYALFNLLKP